MPTKHEGKCHCGKNGHALNSINCPVHGYNSAVDGAGIDALVRDLTQVHAPAKSYARKILTDYLSRLHSQIIEEVEKERNRDDIELIDVQSYKEALAKAQSIINQAFKDL